MAPGGTHRNLDSLEADVSWDDSITDVQKILLADAQTSGGLLIAVSDEKTGALLSALESHGVGTRPIGSITDQAVRHRRRTNTTPCVVNVDSQADSPSIRVSKDRHSLTPPGRVQLGIHGLGPTELRRDLRRQQTQSKGSHPFDMTSSAIFLGQLCATISSITEQMPLDYIRGNLSIPTRPSENFPVQS